MTIKSLAITIFIALAAIILTAAPTPAQETVAPPNNSSESQAEAPLPENSMAIRIGIVLPKANFFEDGVNSSQIAASIREIIGSRFSGSGIEIIALDARLPQAIAAEAGEKNCFYILQTTISRKRSGARLNSLPLNAGAAQQQQQQATVLYKASDLASTTKAKDEFTFEYSLISTDDNSVKAKNSFKTKAKADGEDVLSPVIENILKAVLAAAK
ncbi:MAG: hypothetical protein M3384_03800 [Acidobacteriota bacterium]|nr:hypothetical protein [Acidobacteriota bacterium]